MPIFRNQTQIRYTVIDHAIFENQELTLKDRGLLTTMLSLSDGWDFSINGLCHILPDGKSSISESLKRIEKLGYLTRTVMRDTNGRFSDYLWEIFETPQNTINEPESDFRVPENPKKKNPNSGIPKPEIRAQSIINKSINKQSIYSAKDNKKFNSNSNRSKQLKRENSFHNFEQRQYSSGDYQKIEQALINKSMNGVDS